MAVFAVFLNVAGKRVEVGSVALDNVNPNDFESVELIEQDAESIKMRFRWSSLRRKSSVGPGLSALIRYYRTLRATLRGLTGLMPYLCRQMALAAGE